MANVARRARERHEAATGRPQPYAEQLHDNRKLTLTQLAAVATVARIYRQWSKQNGSRFNPKSQSFEFTTAGESERILTVEEQERIDDVNEAWRRLEKCVPLYPREAWFWVIELCVFEHHVPLYVLPDIIVVLNRVAYEFGIGAEVEEVLQAQAPVSRYKRKEPQFPNKAPIVLPSLSVVPPIKPISRSKKPPKPKSRSEKFETGDYAMSRDAASLPAAFLQVAEKRRDQDRAETVRKLEDTQRRMEAEKAAEASA